MMTKTGETYASSLFVKDMAPGGTLLFDGGSVTGRIFLFSGNFSGSSVTFRQMTITTSSFTDSMFFGQVSLAWARIVFDRCTIDLANPVDGAPYTSAFHLGPNSADFLHFELSGTTIAGKFPVAYGAVVFAPSSHNNATILLSHGTSITIQNGRSSVANIDLIGIEGGPNAGAVYAVEDSSISGACRDPTKFDCYTHGIRFSDATLGDCSVRFARSNFSAVMTETWLALFQRDTTLPVHIDITDCAFASSRGASVVPFKFKEGTAHLNFNMTRTTALIDSRFSHKGLFRFEGSSVSRGSVHFTDVTVTFLGQNGRRFLTVVAGNKLLDVVMTRVTVTNAARAVVLEGGPVADVSFSMHDCHIGVRSYLNVVFTAILLAGASNVRFNISGTDFDMIGGATQLTTVFEMNDCPACVIVVEGSTFLFNAGAASTRVVASIKDNIEDSRIILHGSNINVPTPTPLLLAIVGTGAGTPLELDVGCPNSPNPNTFNKGPVIVSDHVPAAYHSLAKCPPLEQEGLLSRPVRPHWLKTVIGQAGQGSADGGPDTGQVDTPNGLAYDPLRDEMYVSQRGTGTIRKVNVLTWEITTYAGTGTSVATITNGPRLGGATFGHPGHMVYDPQFRRLVISDDRTHHARGILTATGAVYTIAGSGSAGSVDGSPGVGHLDTPVGVTLTMDNATVLIACKGNDAVRIAPAAGGGALTTQYGSLTEAGFVNGIATAARMTAPTGIVTARSLSLVFVLNAGSCVRTIDLVTDYVGHLVGVCESTGVLHDGIFNAARFDGGMHLVMGKNEDALYLTEPDHSTVRRLDLMTKTTHVAAGLFDAPGTVDGPMGTSRLETPSCLTSDYRTGMVYACSGHRLVALGSRHYVKVFAGTPKKNLKVNGVPGTGSLLAVRGIDCDVEGKAFFAVSGQTRTVAKITAATGAILHVAGSGTASNTNGNGVAAAFLNPHDLLMDTTSRLLYVGSGPALMTMTVVAPYTVAIVGGDAASTGAVDGAFSTHRVEEFTQLSHGPDVATLYFTDRLNHAVRSFGKATQSVATIAGVLTSAGTADGAATTTARFNEPTSIGYRRKTSVLYIGDSQQQLIRTVDMRTLMVATVLGTQGVAGYMDRPGADFQMDQPGVIRFTPDEDTLLLTDFSGGCIRVIDVDTLTPRDPIGLPGYVGWIPTEVDRPAVPRQAMTRAQVTPLFDGPAEVARLSSAWSMPRTYPPGFEGLIMGDELSGAVLHYTGDGIDAMMTGSTFIDRPATSEQWYYTRIVGETTATCSNLAQNGIPLGTRFDIPTSLAVDRPGNAIYTCDQDRFILRRIDLLTLTSTTIGGAGSVQGTADGSGGGNNVGTARFGVIGKFLMEDRRRRLYFLEGGLHGVRQLKVDELSSPTAYTLFSGTRAVPGTADGGLGVGRHMVINGICFDGYRGWTKHLFVVESACTVRRLEGTTGAVTTIAGTASSCGVVDGTAGTARFKNPSAIAVSPTRRVAFIVEHDSHCLRQMTLSTFEVTSIFCTAGGTSGVFPGTRLFFPTQVIISRDDASLFVLEQEGNTIRRVDLNTWDSELIAGTYGEQAASWEGGSPGVSRLRNAQDFDQDPDTGYIWVADTGVCALAVLSNSTATGHVSGDPNIWGAGAGYTQGTRTTARYTRLESGAYDPIDNVVYVGNNGRVERVDMVTGANIAFAGTTSASSSSAPLSPGRLTTALGRCTNLHIDVDARYLYMGFRSTSRTIYRAALPGAATLELVAGGSTGGFAAGGPGVSRWQEVSGLETVEGDGLLYVSDRLNQAIRTVNKTTKEASLAVVGCGGAHSTDGSIATGCVHEPTALKYNKKRRGFFLTQSSGSAVRFFSFEEDYIRTVAGSGTFSNARMKGGHWLESSFSRLTDLATAPSQDELFIVSYPFELARLDLTSGRVSHFLGDYGEVRPRYPGSSSLTRLKMASIFPVGQELAVLDQYTFKKVGHFTSDHWVSSGDSAFTVTSVVGPRYGDDAVRSAVSGVVVVERHGAVYVTLPRRGTIVKVRMATHEATEVWGRPLYADETAINGPTAADATFARPSAIEHDPETHTLYVAEYTAGRIRSTVLDGAGLPSASTTTLTEGLASPVGLALGHHPSHVKVLFATDDVRHVVETVDTSTGAVLALAGVAGTAGYKNGAAATALFRLPTGVAYHRATGSLFIADKGNHVIRRLLLDTLVVSTLAGVPNLAGHIDGGAAYARFDYPFGVAVRCANTTGPNDLTLFVSDANGHGVRAVDVTKGVVRTLAGRLGFRSSPVDGNGTAARFGTLQGIAAHPCRCGLAYTADATFGRVAEIVTGGLSAFLGNSTLHGQPPNGRSGPGAVIADPWGIAFDYGAGRAFVASRGFSVVYAVDLSTRTPVVVAGAVQSPGTAGGGLGINRLQNPGHLLHTHAMDSLFISDEGARTVRQLRLINLVLSTLAGAPGAATPVDGTGTSAKFNYPTGIARSVQATMLLVGDFNAGAVRRIDTTTRAVTTVAGQLNNPGNVDGISAASRLTEPNGMARHHSTGLVYIACGDGAVRTLDEGRGDYLATLIGIAGSHGGTDGDFATALLDHPTDVALGGGEGDEGDTLLYIASGATVRRAYLGRAKVDTAVGTSAGAGTRHGAFGKVGTIRGLALEEETLFIAHSAGEVAVVRPSLPPLVEARAVLSAKPPGHANGVVGDAFGVYDKRAEFHVSLAAGQPDMAAITPGGTRDTGRIHTPNGAVIHVARNVMYVSSQGRHCIMAVDLSLHTMAVFSGTAGTSGGTDAAASSATWNQPADLVFKHSEGDDPATLYAASAGGHTVRTVAMAAPNTVTTIAGSGTAGTLEAAGVSAELNHPMGLAFDKSEANLFITARFGHNLRMMNMATSMVSLAAGPSTVAAGNVDGTGTAVRFNDPVGVRLRRSTSMLYITTRGALRRFDSSTGAVTTVAGSGYIGGPVFGSLETSTFGLLLFACFDPHDDSLLYTAEFDGGALGVVDLDKGTRSIVAGTPGFPAGAFYEGPANRTAVVKPWGVAVHSSTGEIYFTSSGGAYIGKAFRPHSSTPSIRKIAGDTSDLNAVFDADALKVNLHFPMGVSYNAARRVLFVIDTSNCRIHEYRRDTGQMHLLLGPRDSTCGGGSFSNGGASTAVLDRPLKIEYVASVDTLFWTEAKRVAMMRFGSMVTKTLAGKNAVGHIDGVVGTSRFTRAMPIAVTRDAKTIYVGDLTMHSLRVIDMTTTGTPITTLVGTASGHADGPQATAELQSPSGFALRHSTGLLYIVTRTGTVRYYDPMRQHLFTLAGVSGQNTAVIPGRISNGGPARLPGAFNTALSYDEDTLFVTGSQLVTIDLRNLVLRGDLGSPTQPRCGDGAGTTAGQTGPQGIALAETSIFIASTECNVVQEVGAVDWGVHDASTLRTTVATVAGNISGRVGVTDSEFANETLLMDARGIAVDQARDVAYVSDRSAIRLLSLRDYSLVTVLHPVTHEAPDPASCAAWSKFGRPAGLLLDHSAQMLFIAEAQNHLILRANVTSHTDVTYTVFAGEGTAGSADHATGAEARFNGPVALAWALGAAPALLVADEFSHAVRSVANTAPHGVTTIAGQLGALGHTDGVGSSAKFDRPAGIAVMRLKHMAVTGAAFVSCRGSHTLRRVDLSTNAVTTVIGRPYVAGIGSGTAAAAVFYAPGSVSADPSGTGLFVSDGGSRTVKHVVVDGAVGAVESSTFAGYPSSLSDEVAPARDGFGGDALFTSSVGQAVVLTGARAGEPGDVVMLVADRGTIRIAFNTTAAVTTVAGRRHHGAARVGDRFQTAFNAVAGVAHDPKNDHLFVASARSGMITKVDLGSGSSSLLAGHPTETGNVAGTAATARFTQLSNLLYDPATSVLYACDAGAHNIRRVAVPSGSVAILAGSAAGVGVAGVTNAVGAAARFHAPVCAEFDATRSSLLVCDRDNHVLRKVDVSTEAVSLLSGAFGAAGIIDGAPATARFSKPSAIVRRAKTGAFYVACLDGHVIREMDPSTFAVARVVGSGADGATDGPGVSALLSAPSALAVSPDQRYLYVASGGGTHEALRRVDMDGAMRVDIVAGVPGTSSAADGPLGAARFGAISQLAVDPTGGLFAASTTDHTVKRIAGLDGFGRLATSMAVSTVAGQPGNGGVLDAVGQKALLDTPSGISVSVKRDAVFFAETSSCLVRMLSLSTYAVTTVAGQQSTCGPVNGAALSPATLNGPTELFVDDNGDKVYVAEQSAAIRRVDLVANTVGLFAGTHTLGLSDGVGGLMGVPAGMQLHPDGARLFFCDTTNHRIRSAAVTDGALSTLAGSTAGFEDGVGLAAKMNEPRGLALRPGTASLYFADRYSNAVRTFDPATNAVGTLVGWGPDAGVGAGSVDAKPGLWQPTGIAFADFDTIYVSSQENDALWRIEGGEIMTIGTGARRRHGPALDAFDSAHAAFHGPAALSVDSRSGELYVSDSKGHAIRRVMRTNKAEGFVTTIVGNSTAPMVSARDGSGPAVRLYWPTRGVRLVEYVVSGNASDDEESLLIVEPGPGLIRRVWPRSGRVAEFIGKRISFGAVSVGVAADVGLETPAGLVIDEHARVMYIASMGGGRVLRYDFTSANVSLVFGDGNTHVDGDQATARVNQPDGLDLSGDRATLFVASRGSHVIRATVLATTTTSTPYGTVGTAGTAAGTGTAAQFDTPSDVKLHKRTAALFVVSTAASVISKVDLATGAVSPIAGTSGSTSAMDGAAGTMHNPTYAAFGAQTGVDDDYLYVADASSHLLRRMHIRGSLTTAVGDVEHSHGAHIDGVPRHSRAETVGGPIPMSDGSVFFPDVESSVLRSLIGAAIPVTPTPTLTRGTTVSATVASTPTHSCSLSVTLQHPPEGQLLEDGAGTPGRVTGGVAWAFPTSAPWRSINREYHPDGSGEALGRVYISTAPFAAALNVTGGDGATTYHAVMAVSFRAAARLPLLPPVVGLRLACFASQADATSWTSPLSLSTAKFKAWDRYVDARRQRSGAVRYPLPSDCEVFAAEVHLIGFAVVTNADLHFARGVEPDDVFTRLVANRPWVDPTTATPVDSLADAVRSPFAVGTDTAVPGGSGFSTVSPLVPGFSDGTFVFQCGGTDPAALTKTIALSADNVAAASNGSLRVAAGALVFSVGSATAIEITAHPSGYTLATEIPAFAAAVSGYLSWVGIPDAPLPLGTTSLTVAFNATLSAGACSVFDALILGFRSELSDRLDDTANIAAVSTPPSSSVIADGGAEGQSNTVWPAESKWVAAGAIAGRHRPLWVRGGRFSGSDGSRSFVVPAQPTAIVGRESAADTADVSVTYGGGVAAGNVSIDVTPYASTVDEGLMDFQLSFVFSAAAVAVSTTHPADLPPSDRAVVESLRVNASLHAQGLGWDGAAEVLPATALRPSCGSYGRRFRATGRVPLLSRSLLLTLSLCPGCAVDSVDLLLKARPSSAAVFALPPVAEVLNAAALNTGYDGSTTAAWTTTGAAATASTSDAAAFPPSSGAVYPSARSVAVAYAVGPSLFEVCGGTTMEQTVSIPADATVGVDARRGYVHASIRLVSAASVPLSVRVEAHGCTASADCGGHVVTEVSMRANPRPTAAVGSPYVTALGGTVSPAVVELEAAAAFLPSTARSLRIFVSLPVSSDAGDCALFDDLKVGLTSQADRTVTATVRVGRVRLAKMQALFYATLHARFVVPNPGGDFRTRYASDAAYRGEVQAAVLQEISTATGIDLAALWVAPTWPLFPL